MKRRIVFMLLLLVAGAVVNVAVAWVLALSVNLDLLYDQASGEFGDVPPAGPTYRDWIVWRNARGGVSCLRSFWFVMPCELPDVSSKAGRPSFVFDWADAATPDFESKGNPAIAYALAGAIAWQCGWPQPSLGGLVYCEEHDGRSGWAVVSYHHSFATGHLQRNNLLGDTRIFGWRPLWPGFAINTVFYAAILWLLFAAPFALRRRLRVKRGLCPKCAYDLRGRAPMSDVCPECGWGVTGAARGTGGTPTP